MAKTMTFKEAAVKVLAEAGEPLHYRELTDRIVKQALVQTTGVTPDATLNALVSVDLKREGDDGQFVRTRRGFIGLRNWSNEDLGEREGTGEKEQRRVRTPYYPLHSEVRLILPIWVGWKKSDVTGLRGTLSGLRGTPQNQVTWIDPDAWIPERLSGTDEELAQAIWQGSERKVNPRFSQGHWLLANHYELVEEGEGAKVALTERGIDFVDNPEGEAELLIDQREGLAKLLAIVADKGPARFGEFVDPWSEYLQKRSNFNSDSTIKDTLRRRLSALLDRRLLSRSSLLYSTTESGLAYLESTGGEDPGGGTEQQLRELVRKQETSIREAIHALLLDMDPYAFEHLVRHLLIAMDYTDVNVTSRSADGGVDVFADIDLGITSVREVVQAKRHKKTIQRKVLDALRGSLHRFDAVRGTIITTSKFSSGTQKAAFERGAAPITLIDGEKLIDLLIEHGIGVRKKELHVLERQADDFVEVEDSEAIAGGES